MGAVECLVKNVLCGDRSVSNALSWCRNPIAGVPHLRVMSAHGVYLGHLPLCAV